MFSYLLYENEVDKIIRSEVIEFLVSWLLALDMYCSSFVQWTYCRDTPYGDTVGVLCFTSPEHFYMGHCTDC